MPKVRRLATQDNCRQAIAWVFREVEAKKMEPTMARVLIYAALSISGILAEHEIEKRLQALEATIPFNRRRA